MKPLLLLFGLVLLLSCQRKWTDKDKNDFYSGCLSNAQVNKDVVNPKKYCSCLLEKIVAKYPNANDAQYIKYDSTAKKLAQTCLDQH